MTSYRWTCLACEQANDAETATCIRCGCPSTPNATEVEAHQAKYRATGGKQYQCFKCGHDKCEMGETRNAGGMFSSVFELETERFSFVACRRCGYTEFYRGKRDVMSTIFDMNF